MKEEPLKLSQEIPQTSNNEYGMKHSNSYEFSLENVEETMDKKKARRTRKFTQPLNPYFEKHGIALSDVEPNENEEEEEFSSLLRKRNEDKTYRRAEETNSSCCVIL